MKILYFDCFAGVSGDMTVGALIDLGVDFEFLKSELKKIDLDGYTLSIKKSAKNNIAGTKFDVNVTDGNIHRKFKDIKKLIFESKLSEKIKMDILSIFEIVAIAESEIHNVPLDDVVFHEVGGIDSIIDISAAVIGVTFLKVDKIYSSKIHTGQGFTNSMHGKIPIPSPASLKILEDIPVYSTGINSELTTPTGAAIIKHYSMGFVPTPNFIVKQTGYGAGSKNFEIPNLLRVVLGEQIEKKQFPFDGDSIIQLETNIDDLNPELTGYISQRLFELGALDVYTTPIFMKKNRNGIILSVLLNKIDVDKIVNFMFQESSTSGIRINEVDRIKLFRRVEKIETEFGEISVKVNFSNNKIFSITPEYEDCKKIAEEQNIPLKKIYEIVQAAAGLKIKNTI